MLPEQQKSIEARETRHASPLKTDIDTVIKHHVWGAIGAGFLPFPVIDYLALTGIQVNLVRKLAHGYGIPFFQENAKGIISALISSAVPGLTAAPLAFSIAKIIPVFGQIAGVTALPAIAGATTYALGKVFVQHFASGGTFLTFDPEKVKDYYLEMFKEGERVAAEVEKEKKEDSAETQETLQEPVTAEHAAEEPLEEMPAAEHAPESASEELPDDSAEPNQETETPENTRGLRRRKKKADTSEH